MAEKKKVLVRKSAVKTHKQSEKARVRHKTRSAQWKRNSVPPSKPETKIPPRNSSRLSMRLLTKQSNPARSTRTKRTERNPVSLLLSTALQRKPKLPLPESAQSDCCKTPHFSVRSFFCTHRGKTKRWNEAEECLKFQADGQAVIDAVYPVFFSEQILSSSVFRGLSGFQKNPLSR